VDLEGGSSNDFFTPQVLRQDLSTIRNNSGSYPSPEVTSINTEGSLITYATPFTLNMKENHIENVQKKQQHIMAMISRPIACVLITQ
jgi:hypothetical protein